MPVPSRLSAAGIRKIALARGASACGLVPAWELAEYGRFRTAAANAPQALGYLLRSPSPRADIRGWFPGAKSILVCAFQYWHSGLDHVSALEKAGEPAAYLKKTGRKARPEFISGVKAAGLRPKISRYALAPDYHEVIKGRLALMLADIRIAYPGAEGKPFTDTSPVMEKELGRLAGLGFRGRNTLLVSEELGSWFFIGGLALTLDAGPDAERGPGEDGPPGCGSCGKCAAACPTGALKDGVMDAGLCVSYWTTEAKTAATGDIIRKSGGYVFGCDICQEVCPYNGKTPDRVLLPEFKR